MEKFIKFSEKYFIKELFLIFIVLLLLFGIFYGKQDQYLIDVGREAYIPWQMLKGKLLYKDIFNVYGPLGYQINAIAYSLFGVSLNTLYWMGFLNSIAICFTTFFTAKLFLNNKLSLAVTGLTISVCIYIKTLFNFIFTYSYSAVYALSGFLLSLLMMLLFIRDKKNKYLSLAFLFAGFSFANKIENLPYFALLFLCLPFFLKKDWKNYLTVLGAFFLFPIISFGTLLIQGVSFSDLINSLDLIKRLVHTPAVEYFYNAYGLYFNPLFVKTTFIYLGKILLVGIPTFLIFYGLNYIQGYYIENKNIKKFLNIFISFLILCVITKQFSRFYENMISAFCWVGIVCLFIFTGLLLFKLFKNHKAETIDNMYVFMIISGILVSVKGLMAISIEIYGTFSLAALFLPFVIFFVNYIPRIFKIVDKKTVEKTVVNLCLVIIILYLSANIFKTLDKPVFPVSTANGSIFVKKELKSQNDLINFIIHNTHKDSVIVAAPEGAIINFLAQRDSNNFYYYLIPVNVQIFGEEKILNDFKKNPPDYFLLNNIPYSPFNVGIFCSYAPRVCDFIEKEYKPFAKVDDGIEFVLYKKN